MKIEWHSNQVIAAIAGSLLMFSPALADRGGVLRWLPITTGAGLLLTIPSSTHSREEDDDFVAYLKAGWDAFTTEAVKEANQILADVGSPRLNRWAESVSATFDDPLALFCKAHEHSFLVVAESDGGKTWLMHQSVLHSYDRKDQVLILDKSYGKRDWNWWGLPVNKTVFKFGDKALDSLSDILYTAYQERERRKTLTEQAVENGQPAPTFPRLRVYITEWNQTYETYEKGRARALAAAGKDNAASVSIPPVEDIDHWVSELLFDGHGYNIVITLEVHSAAVGRSKIDQSQQSQVNWILLGSTAVKVSEVAKLIPNAKDWVMRVQAARSLPGMGRTGIIIIRGTPYLYNPVPYGDGLVVPEVEDTRSDVEQWLDLRKPDILDYLANHEGSSPSSCFDQRFKLDFPKGCRTRRADNPYWVAFSDFVNSQKVTV